MANVWWIGWSSLVDWVVQCLGPQDGNSGHAIKWLAPQTKPNMKGIFFTYSSHILHALDQTTLHLLREPPFSPLHVSLKQKWSVEEKHVIT